MPTQRHRTVIEVEVDDRKIRGLDRTLHRAFDDQMLARFERVLDRSARTIEAMTKAAERFEAVMKRAGGGGAGPATAGMAAGRVAPTGRAGGGGDLHSAIVALSRNVQELNRTAQGRGGGAGGGGGVPVSGGGPGFWNRAGSTALGSYLGGLGRNFGSGGQGFFAQMAGGIPIVGGMLQGAISNIHNFANMHAAAQQQISRTVGTLGVRSVRGRFGQFGLAAPEAMQAAQGIAGMAGRSGRFGVDEGLMNASLAMQHYGGIREAPGIIRAVEAGGGFAEGPREMFQAVSAGLQAGIREARLGQFIGVATQVLEQARLEGTDTSLQSVLRTFVGFSRLGAGFQGEQGQRAAMTAMGQLRRFQPGADVASLVGLRAVGFGTPGGPSYHEALRMFQTEPARVMPQLLETIRGMAPGNRDAQVELMRQIAPRLLGFTPTIQQAESMVGGDMSAFGAEVTAQGGGEFLAGRRREVGGAFGVPATEAALQNRRLSVGAAVHGTSRRLMQREMSITEAVLPRIANGIESIFGWLQEQWNAIREDPAAWMRDILRGAVEGLLPGMPEIPDSGEMATDARNALVRAGGGAQYLINEIAAAGAEAMGADLETQNQFRRTASQGRRMMEGSMDAPPEPTGPGATGAITPGPTVPVGPQSSAAGALRYHLEQAAQAAGQLDRDALPEEGAVAVG